jgi:hypothetical protein
MNRNLKLEELVVMEATNLKKYATKKELARLNLKTLDGNDIEKCIYGQMTGNCLTDRAKLLIEKCATRVYKTVHLRACTNIVNVDPREFNISCSRERLNYYSSPIENFVNRYTRLSRRSTKVNKLVSFLKGETDLLVL